MIEPSQQIWKADWMFFLPEENPILKLPRHSHNLAGFEACSSAGVRPPAISSSCLSSFPRSFPSSSFSYKVGSCWMSGRAKASPVAASPPIGPKDSWVTSLLALVSTKKEPHFVPRKKIFTGRCYAVDISFSPKNQLKTTCQFLWGGDLDFE